MVSAGRILILPKGAWDNLTSYSMLDLVTASNNIAYLARQASVGVNPISDVSNTYWQPFGSTVTADGETLIIDANGIISMNLDNDTIVYDSTNGYVKVSDTALEKALEDLTDVNISSALSGQILVYNITSGKWENSDVLDDKEDKPTILTSTLSVGSTSLTFTNAALTATAIVDIYTDVYGVAPKTVDDSTVGTLVLTFDAQLQTVTVKLIIREG